VTWLRNVQHDEARNDEEDIYAKTAEFHYMRFIFGHLNACVAVNNHERSYRAKVLKSMQSHSLSFLAIVDLLCVQSRRIL